MTSMVDWSPSLPGNSGGDKRPARQSPSDGLDSFYSMRLYRDGDVIFAQGARAAEAYLLDKGGVRISKDEHHIIDLRPRALFGELAIIADMPRLMTARAIGDTLCYAISRQNFKRLLTALPPADQGMILALIAYVQDAHSGALAAGNTTFDKEHELVHEIIEKYESGDSLERMEVFLAHMCRGFLDYARHCLESAAKP